MKLLEPHSLDALLKLLEDRNEHCIFRGQSPQHRKLNCTLARELRGESNKLPRNYIPVESLASWTPQNLYVYHRTIFGSLQPHEDVTRPLAGRGDPFFEIIRYIQQNPSQEKIVNAIPNHPTSAIEFSESSRTALYFSSDKPDEDGPYFVSRETQSPLFSLFPTP